jgi:hypothetical protein
MRFETGDFVFCPTLGAKEAFYGIVTSFLGGTKNYGEQYEIKDVSDGTGWVRTTKEAFIAYGPLRNKL